MMDIGSRSFAQLGGDSLAAIQFARYVGELCGVNLPVSFVLDHSHSLQAIADRVQQLVRCGPFLGVTCPAWTWMMLYKSVSTTPQ